MSIDPVAFHDFEQAGWQKAAEHYPGSFGTLTIHATEPLLDAAGVGPSRARMRVLDVATGPGYVAAAAAGRGADVVGVDFSPLMIAEARSFLYRAPWIALAPGFAMCLLVIGINLLGDGARERLDPRLKSRGGEA